jgi:glycosyltransferase involved in cell wall biosynthesis
LRVLYDYQAFMQRQGGVSRYFAELLGALKGMEGFEALLPRFFSDNEYLASRITFLTQRHFKGKERIMGALNRIGAVKTLRANFDVFHPTYYRPYFLKALKRPLVITVHDMIHELFGSVNIRDDGTAKHKRILCDRAARIIAVSANTKKDVCTLLGVPEEKVSVIPHATNLRYAGGPRLHDRPYALYVGTRSGYKNFSNLLEAAATVLPRHGIDLVCVGGGTLSSPEKESIRECGLSERVFHIPSPTSEQLSSLYYFASVFCYPSFYEGFGIPLLEAFACGCPVAASSTSSLPEVAGPAAEYFDPRSVESISSAIERVVLDRSRASELVRAGTDRLGSFSWKESAIRTLQVYREAS